MQKEMRDKITFEIKDIRKSRAPVLFDFDDFLIFNKIDFHYSCAPLQVKTKLPSIQNLKDHLMCSHNALIIHLRRLEKFKLINIERGKGSEYKTKFVDWTNEGKGVYSAFFKSFENQNILEWPEFKKYHQSKFKEK